MSLHSKIFLQVTFILVLIFSIGGYVYLHSIEKIYQANVDKNIALDTKRIQSELKTIKTELVTTALGVKQNEDIISMLHLVSFYQDKKDYNKALFDIVKKESVGIVNRWVQDDTQGIKLYDANKELVLVNGFINGSLHKGYISFDPKGAPRYKNLQRVQKEAEYQKLTFEQLDTITGFVKEGNYILSFTTAVTNAKELVGYLQVQKSFTQKQLQHFNRYLINPLYFETRKTTPILPSFLTAQKLKELKDSKSVEIKRVTLFEKDPALYARFVIDKTLLQETKEEFFYRMVTVLGLMAVLAFGLFWYFSKYTIIDPLYKLLGSIEMIKDNRYEAIEHSKNDEIGKIIENFNQVFHELANNYSELERLQSKLSHKNYILQSILDTAPVGIWLNDTEGKPVILNRWVKENTALTKQQQQQCFYTDMRTLESNKVEGFNENVTLADGSTGIIKTIKTKLTDEDNKVIGVLGIGLDITRQQKQQWQLERLNAHLKEEVQTQVEQIAQKDKLLQEQSKLAAMGEMISAIAHQWRQPLNALSINIQNLDDDYEDGLIDEEFIEEFIQNQTKTIGFMSKTIDDFRNFFKTDKEKKEFNVITALQNVVKLFEAQLKNNNITLTIEGEPFSCYSYQSEFQQVILNLISNAKDAIVDNNRPQRQIIIKVHNSKKSISVCDSGGGVQEEFLQRIFEPYYTTKEQGKGTGIGLYMSQVMVVEHMQGKIRAFNTPKGLCVEILMQAKRQR